MISNQFGECVCVCAVALDMYGIVWYGMVWYVLCNKHTIGFKLIPSENGKSYVMQCDSSVASN